MLLNPLYPYTLLPLYNSTTYALIPLLYYHTLITLCLYLNPYTIIHLYLLYPLRPYSPFRRNLFGPFIR